MKTCLSMLSLACGAIFSAGGVKHSGAWQGTSLYLAALPADQRATLQNCDPLKNPFTNLKQVDNLSGYSERSLWQRLQLWRLGTAPTRASASVGWLMLITLIIIPPMVFIPPLVGVEIQPGTLW